MATGKENNPLARLSDNAIKFLVEIGFFRPTDLTNDQMIMINGVTREEIETGYAEFKASKPGSSPTS